jgi:hypothetical protein
MIAFIIESDSKYRITDETIDVLGSEVKCKMSLYVNDKLVSYIEYSILGDTYYIEHIKSIEKRKGYATILAKEFYEKYKDKNIDLGYSTPDGTQLINYLQKEVGMKPTERKNKHISLNIIKKIKDITVKNFLNDAIKNGVAKTFEKWLPYLKKNPDIWNKYDFNDIADIAYWVQGAVDNDNDPYYEEPPYQIMDTLKTLI